MLPFPHAEREMTDELLERVRRYWTDLRGARLAPRRAEIDPREIEEALEFAMILEHAPSGGARIRIAGMHLCELMGMEIRGMPAAALIAPPDRARFDRLIGEVFAAPAMLDLSLNSTPTAQPRLEARALFLPLVSDLDETSRALGYLRAEGNIGTPPRRMTLISHRLRRLGGDETSRVAEPGFAETGDAFARPERLNGGDRNAAPTLRLVGDEDD